VPPAEQPPLRRGHQYFRSAPLALREPPSATASTAAPTWKQRRCVSSEPQPRALAIAQEHVPTAAQRDRAIRTDANGPADARRRAEFRPSSERRVDAPLREEEARPSRRTRCTPYR
jgi:hypothetical protein